MSKDSFVDEDEKKRLGFREADELADLRFRCWTDLPFSSADYKRLAELNKKVQ